jgi:rare lipoprotein A
MRLILIITLFLLTSCSKKIIESGKASYYADKFVGRKTSNGETFSQKKRTAAHPTLPFGTKVKVTNLTTGKTVKVRINDRGPFVAGRIIDLSRKAARKIGMIESGVASVQLKYNGSK